MVLQDRAALQRTPWLLEPGNVKRSSCSLVSPVASLLLVVWLLVVVALQAWWVVCSLRVLQGKQLVFFLGIGLSFVHWDE